jgi:hypothetical protein
MAPKKKPAEAGANNIMNFLSKATTTTTTTTGAAGAGAGGAASKASASREPEDMQLWATKHEPKCVKAHSS